MQFCSKKALSQITGFSGSTLKKYRLTGNWTEGIHWQKVNSRCVLYNLPLILDWLSNRCEPIVHQRAIDRYLKSLPSNQPKRGKV